MVVTNRRDSHGSLAVPHLEFVTSSNKQKKPSFTVRILARIHARVLALYLGILKYMPEKQLNCAR